MVECTSDDLNRIGVTSDRAFRPLSLFLTLLQLKHCPCLCFLTKGNLSKHVGHGKFRAFTFSRSVETQSTTYYSMASAQAELNDLASSSKSKKKKSKKKAGAAKAEANGDLVARNGAKSAADIEADELDEDVEPETVSQTLRSSNCKC
jgi:hypothetical protein